LGEQQKNGRLFLEGKGGGEARGLHSCETEKLNAGGEHGSRGGKRGGKGKSSLNSLTGKEERSYCSLTGAAQEKKKTYLMKGGEQARLEV